MPTAPDMTRNLFLFSALVLASACSGPDEESDTDLQTGDSLEGALVLDGFGAIAVLIGENGPTSGYLCGQGDSLDQTRWLASDGDGGLSGDGVSVQVDDDHVDITGPSGQSWSGTLTPMDDGGLYQAQVDYDLAGLIAFEGEDGEIRSVGTLTQDIDFFQVEPVGTIVGAPPTIDAVADTTDGPLEFTLNRLP